MCLCPPSHNRNPTNFHGDGSTPTVQTCTGGFSWQAWRFLPVTWLHGPNAIYDSGAQYYQIQAISDNWGTCLDATGYGWAENNAIQMFNCHNDLTAFGPAQCAPGPTNTCDWDNQ